MIVPPGVAVTVPPAHVVVRYRESGTVSKWRDAIDETTRAIDAYFIPADATELPGVLARQQAMSAVTAFLCKGTACDAPLGTFDELAAALRRAR